ncbi:ATP-grasp domain-containing protein [Saccharothrix obliqua]|uniref:ATP-grasp domain-containing protein n=1 Tax=Saccharothrix obliqua TaxID=2861747 RepID=UPI001C5F5534|nr:ATP-grasp domain-containing protein [Saccharothrix obliqua]MBW4718018.1 ATP-grasp domain-containing protein [Saccharothrix obliqua]
MTTRPVIIVGFLAPLPTRTEFEEGSMVLVDEPDVIRKRDIAAKMAGAPTLREIVPWEYQRPGAADEFFNAHPDLDPAYVVPLVEYATPFAARLAERYGVPGATSGAAQLLRDKELLRRVTRAAGVRNPESRSVDGPDDVRAFMAEHPGPVVLKPANRQASLGTKVLHDAAEVDEAWAECLAGQDEGILVPDRVIPLRMLVETFVRGAEFSVEMLVRDGVPLFTNVTEKTLFPGPRPIELGHLVPADLPEATSDLLVAQTGAVLRAVGFGTGVVHCEWILSDGVPFLVECAGRFPGDGITWLIEQAYPIALADHYYALMRGDDLPPLPAKAERAAAVRFLQAEPGEVVSVAGVAEVEALPGVLHVALAAQPGEHVRELRSSWDRAGSVTVLADTPGEAAKLAERAAESIRLEVRRAG